jgi:putative membrane protein
VLAKHPHRIKRRGIEMNAIGTVQLLANTDWNHMGGGAWVLMGIGMITFWGLVIFGVVWLMRTLTDHRPAGVGDGGEPSALEVLDRKLAEGVISVEDYRERRHLLTGEPEGGQRRGSPPGTGPSE